MFYFIYLNNNNIRIRHTWVAFCTGWGVPALHTVATSCSRPVTIVVIIVTLTGISTYIQKNQKLIKDSMKITFIRVLTTIERYRGL